MGNLAGSARRKEEYLFKKKHPIRWKMRQFLKLLMKWLGDDNDLYIKDLK